MEKKIALINKAQRDFRDRMNETEMGSYYEDESMEDFKLDDIHLEQVGIWFSNEIPLPQFSLFIKAMSIELFTEGLVRLLPEMNSGFGTVFLTVFRSDRIPELELDEEEWLGWTMVNGKLELGAMMKRNTRALWITALQTKLQTSAIRLSHEYSIDQIRHFKKNRSGRYEAISGENDDIIMTLVSLAGYMDEDNSSYMEFVETALHGIGDLDDELW